MSFTMALLFWQSRQMFLFCKKGHSNIKDNEKLR